MPKRTKLKHPGIFISFKIRIHNVHKITQPKHSNRYNNIITLIQFLVVTRR